MGLPGQKFPEADFSHFKTHYKGLKFQSREINIQVDFEGFIFTENGCTTSLPLGQLVFD